MKTQYEGKLRCATCKSDSHFDCNDDKSYIKCTYCNREYFDGYDELLQLNQDAIEVVKKTIVNDLEKDFNKKMKEAFKGNKYLKFK